MRRQRVVLRALFAAVATTWWTTPASAHGFGQRYDLPIPLSFYLAGVGTAVVVSFVIVGLFVREAPRLRTYPRIDLLRTPLGRWIASPSLALVLKLLALAALILTIVAGFRGDQTLIGTSRRPWCGSSPGLGSPMFRPSSVTSGR
jgi:hypothetical protein